MPLRANIGGGITGFYGLPIVGGGLMLMLLYTLFIWLIY